MKQHKGHRSLYVLLFGTVCCRKLWMFRKFRFSLFIRFQNESRIQIVQARSLTPTGQHNVVSLATSFRNLKHVLFDKVELKSCNFIKWDVVIPTLDTIRLSQNYLVFILVISFWLSNGHILSVPTSELCSSLHINNKIIPYDFTN